MSTICLSDVLIAIAVAIGTELSVWKVMGSGGECLDMDRDGNPFCVR